MERVWQKDLAGPEPYLPPSYDLALLRQHRERMLLARVKLMASAEWEDY
jgi:hypothetical protein